MTASTSARLAGLTTALHRTIPPEQILTAGPGYDSHRTIWNGAVTDRPALILLCRTASDVQAGVRAARELDVALSVRGGGHDWVGRALTDDGLTLDLTGMREVAVDPGTRIATLAGGATNADIAAAAQDVGFTAVTGTVGSVGMVGLALGGGYGPLSGRFGLAVDNVLSVDLVLADGSLVTVDAEREPELFWALRGGGGNFGVVTALRIRVHPLATVLSGMIVYPAAQAASVLSGLGEHLPGGGPDELTVQCGFIAAPDGHPVVFLAPTWCGDTAAGEAAIAQLTRLGEPIMAQLGPTTPVDMLAATDNLFPFGRHIEIRTRTIPGLTPAACMALAAGGSALTTSMSAVSLHSLHGAAARIPLQDTAFGIRTPHLMVENIAIWEPGDTDPARHRAWVRGIASALDLAALPGGYPNLLADDETVLITHAYGSNAPRLLAAKRRYDPDNVFHAVPLPDHT